MDRVLVFVLAKRFLGNVICLSLLCFHWVMEYVYHYCVFIGCIRGAAALREG